MAKRQRSVGVTAEAAVIRYKIMLHDEFRNLAEMEAHVAQSYKDPARESPQGTR